MEEPKGCFKRFLAKLGLSIGRSDTSSGADQIIYSPFDESAEYDNLGIRDYDVRDYYHPVNGKGIGSKAAKIATSEGFNTLTIFAICANAFTIYLLMDRTGGWRPVLDFAEALFLLFYTGELVIRFCSFAQPLWCLNDFWFKYDLVLIVAMWLEVLFTYFGVLVIVEAKAGGEYLIWLSLYRLARVVRVMRAMPSVVTIIIGISAAVRSVLSTFYVLGFELFCMAIVFRARFGGPPYDGPKETEDEFYDRTGDEELIYRFRSVNEAIFTCLFAGVFTDNITLVMAELSRKSSPMMTLFLVHVILTNLTLLNILIGLVCSVLQEATDSQEELKKLKRVKNQMLKHIEDVDENKDERIGASEFQKLIRIPDVCNFLVNECSIDPKHMILVGATMFHDHKNHGEPKDLRYNELIQAIRDIWAGKPSTSIDLLVLQQEIRDTEQERMIDQKFMHAKVEELTALVKGERERGAVLPRGLTSTHGHADKHADMDDTVLLDTIDTVLTTPSEGSANVPDSLLSRLSVPCSSPAA
jgi:hypothetical protein